MRMMLHRQLLLPLAEKLLFIGDENISAHTYVGGWQVQYNESGNVYRGGEGRYALPQTNDYVEISAYFSSFQLWAVIGTTGYQGKVKLYIDGVQVVPQPTQHQSNPTGPENVSWAWYRSPRLAYGLHTLRLAQDPAEPSAYLIYDGIDLISANNEPAPSLVI